MSLVEKFQITVPAKIESGLEWVDVKSARSSCDYGPKSNVMPQVDLKRNSGDPQEFASAFGGDSDATDHVTGALSRGYTRGNLKGTDDQYAGEHMELFYYTVKDEKGREGFCERNNYLDRI